MKMIPQSLLHGGATVETLQPHRSKIKFVSHQGTRIVSKNQIDYIKSESNYARVYLSDDTEILCSKTMKSIGAKLSSQEFVKVHASYIVNISRIVHISTDYSQLRLESSQLIPISRGMKTNLKRIVDLYID